MFKWILKQPDSQKIVPPEKVASTYKWRQFGVLLATCIGYIGYYIIRLVFTTEQNDIMKAYHFSTANIGLILSCFGIGYGVAKLFMGVFADKCDSNRYLMAGLFLSAVLNIFLGSTKNLYLMMLLMFLMAVTQGMGAAACQKMIQLWWGPRMRGTMYSIWSSAHNAGSFICVAIVQLAVFLFSGSIPAVFYTASVISFIICILILLLGADRPKVVGLPDISTYTGDKVILDNGQVSTSDQTDLSITQIFIKYILKNKLVWAVTLTSMSLYLVRYGIQSWIPSYLVQNKGFDPAAAKWVIGIFELASVPGVIIIGAISDALKGRRATVSIVCVIGMLLCLTCYFFSSNHTVIIIALIIMGNLIYAPLTLVGLMINEVVPKFAVGASTGFMGFFQYIFGETLATALIGILVDHFGWIASNTVLYGASIVAVLFLLYTAISERQMRKKAAE
ncbi:MULTISPECIES: MFS transporter [Lactobacillus]|uniref:MFS transporter n=1 Tax=Lactobacillus panisapium TaxID=2012495 RepID=A0ABX8W6T0_9LACO|nr:MULTISPECIES: MFS transporter [Lactobacillus]MCO6534545.1 MFS transporter [Lactobacillus sp.]MCX8720411.1 MFS transporter [Lactobacillus sp. B4010]MCX8723485.1 MFS transporter [Lactobacillus sp. B4005]MCX8731566.1 MFS transporter [Lactobacillus sp. B4015]MCX8733787.1 MFS transporter [Lactobacillus sp. B4012]